MTGIVVLPLFMLLIVIIYVSWFMKRGSQKGFGRGKNGLWMFIGYSVFLLLSTMIFFMIPLKGSELQGSEKNEAMEQRAQDFYTWAQKGETDQLEDWRVQEWSFPFIDDSLVLQNSEEVFHSGINIFLERTDDVSETIEVVYYQTPMTINGYPIEETYAPEVSLHMETLSLREGSVQELRYKMFGYEFPFGLFEEEGREMWGETTVSHWNSSVLYIRVPADIEIVGDEQTYTEVSPVDDKE